MLPSTAALFSSGVPFVADCDADKNRGGNITARPTLAIETSPGNFHLWYLLDRATPAAQAKLIGDAIRANSGADQDTGVITQCYRVAGTPNFPYGLPSSALVVDETKIQLQCGAGDEAGVGVMRKAHTVGAGAAVASVLPPPPSFQGGGCSIGCQSFLSGVMIAARMFLSG
jgi:hypothetical protein